MFDRRTIGRRISVDYKTPSTPAASDFPRLVCGLHVGSAAHTANRTDQDAFLNIVVPASATYFQPTPACSAGRKSATIINARDAVLGFEVDGSWVAHRETLRILPNFDPTLISTLENRLDQVVTARGRAGIVASDRLMVYVTGGVTARGSRPPIR